MDINGHGTHKLIQSKFLDDLKLLLIGLTLQERNCFFLVGKYLPLTEMCGSKKKAGISIE